MITHVKRNSQKIRTAFIKPSRIEAAVHFKKGDFPKLNTRGHKRSGEKGYYSREREIQVSELNEYIRKMERVYNAFPYFPF